MEILKTVLSSRADYLHALKSAPKMPVPPPPPAPTPVQITPIVQQAMSSTPPSKKGLSTFHTLLIVGIIGFLGAHFYRKFDEARERKRLQ